MKKKWQGIKHLNVLLSKTKSYHLQEGDRLISDPSKLANKFNIVILNKL